MLDGLRSLFVGIVILCCANGNSQDRIVIDGLTTYNYKSEDGLPNNLFLYGMQDSEGFMWFASIQLGVVRFDGVEFKLFGAENGLKQRTIFTLQEGPGGSIWIGAHDREVQVLLDDTIVAYEHMEALRDSVIGRPLISRIHVDEDENLYLFCVDRGMIRISAQGVVSTSKADFDQFTVDINDFKFSDRLCVSSKDDLKNVDDKRLPETEAILKLRLHEGSELTHEFEEYSYPYDPSDRYDRSFVFRKGDNYLLLLNHIAFEIDPKAKKILSTNPIESLKGQKIINVFEKDDLVWLLMENDGIIRGRFGNGGFTIHDHIFQDYYVTHMTQDNSGGLWLSTYKNGLFYIPFPEFKTHSTNPNWNKYYTLADAHSDSVYAYNTSSSSIVIHRSGLVDTLEFDFANKEGLKSTRFSRDGELLFVHSNKMFAAYDLTRADIELAFSKRYDETGEVMLPFGDKDVLVVNKDGISEYRHDHSFERKLSLDLNGGLAAYQDSNTLLIGSNNGLFELDRSRDGTWGENSKNLMPTLTDAVWSICPYKGGYLLARNSSDFPFYRNGEITLLDTPLSNVQRHRIINENDTIWVVDQHGVQTLRLDDSLAVLDYQVYNLSNGLAALPVLDLKVTENRLFISTLKHFQVLDKEILRSRISRDFFKVLGMRCSDSLEIVSSPSPRFSHEQNDLSFFVQSFDYLALGDHEYRYRLMPEDERWRYSDRRQVEFNNISPGEHRFEAEKKDIFGHWRSAPPYTFSISPPFWKTIPFTVLSVLTGLFLLRFIIKSRERRLTTQLQHENQVNALREKALRAQVNPHFLFNTLNSIQKYILKGDFDASNDYLTKFSRLIRMVLDQSDVEKVRLQQEIDILDTYMRLERMRFSHGFDYEISVQDDLDTQLIQLPGMLIQPYVENAIWHGLAEERTKGEIKVEFSAEEHEAREVLLCTVTDNGIGRKASAELKGSDLGERKSFGMTLTAQRLGVTDDDDPFSPIIEDLYHQSGEAAGTRVYIRIPMDLRNRKMKN